MPKKEWWQNFFDEFYVTGWGLRDKERTPQEVKFIIKNVPLKKKDKILDLCCGYGQHAIALAQRGFDVTGLDYSDYELKIAKKETRKRKLKVDFIKADAIKMDFCNEFDVILNIFTSFGYSSDENNQKFINNVGKALKRGGRFLIDYINAAFILKNFREKDWKDLGKNGFLLEESFYDPKTGINNLNWILIKQGKVYKKLNCRLRFYTYPEMETMLAKSGMRVKKTWGSFEEDPFDINHKKMIILAEKK